MSATGMMMNTKKAFKNEMKGRRIYALIAKGITQAYLAQKLEVSEPAVNRAIGGLDNSYLIRAAIQFYTGKSYEWLWGHEAAEPTAEQAERLREKMGVVWCADKSRGRFQLSTMCFNCGDRKCGKTEV